MASGERCFVIQRTSHSVMACERRRFDSVAWCGMTMSIFPDYELDHAVQIFKPLPSGWINLMGPSKPSFKCLLFASRYFVNFFEETFVHASAAIQARFQVRCDQASL